MRRVALCLAVCCLLAGCGEFAGDRSRETATITPAPLPTTEQRPTPVPELAPGLTAEGVADPGALAAAHGRELRGRSYTVVSNRTARAENGSVRARVVRTGRVGPDGFLTTIRVAGPSARTISDTPAHVSFYWNGSVLLDRTVSNGTTYYRRVPQAVYRGRFAFYRSIDEPPEAEAYALLASFETRTLDREPPYRIGSVRLTDRPLFETGELGELGEDIRNVSMRATVTESGLVRSYRVAYDARVDGVSVRVVRTVSFRAVGETTVSRPPWADAAVNATGG